MQYRPIVTGEQIPQNLHNTTFRDLGMLKAPIIANIQGDNMQRPPFEHPIAFWAKIIGYKWIEPDASKPDGGHWEFEWTEVYPQVNTLEATITYDDPKINIAQANGVEGTWISSYDSEGNPVYDTGIIPGTCTATRMATPLEDFCYAGINDYVLMYNLTDTNGGTIFKFQVPQEPVIVKSLGYKGYDGGKYKGSVIYNSYREAGDEVTYATEADGNFSIGSTDIGGNGEGYLHINGQDNTEEFVDRLSIKRDQSNNDVQNCIILNLRENDWYDDDQNNEGKFVSTHALATEELYAGHIVGKTFPASGASGFSGDIVVVDSLQQRLGKLLEGWSGESGDIKGGYPFVLVQPCNSFGEPQDYSDPTYIALRTGLESIKDKHILYCGLDKDDLIQYIPTPPRFNGWSHDAGSGSMLVCVKGFAVNYPKIPAAPGSTEDFLNVYPDVWDNYHYLTPFMSTSEETTGPLAGPKWASLRWDRVRIYGASGA